MPTHAGLGDDQMLAGMGQMLAGGVPPGAPPGPLDPMGGMGDPMAGATPPPMDAGAGGDVVAMLASENAQLRMLVGLGPDDPIPPIPAAPGGGGAPPL